MSNSVLFLSLARKKKIPKRKGPGCARRATSLQRSCQGRVQAKRQKLASLRQSAVFDACPPPAALRPPVNAGEPCGVGPYLWKSNHVLRYRFRAAWPAHKRRGVKRSEFLPLRLKAFRSSPGDSALDFFLLVSFLFVARQKEKYTIRTSERKSTLL